MIMRFILLMTSLVIVSLLVIKGYPGGGNNKAADPAWENQTDAITKANDINLLIQETANKQKQALEKQIQQ